MGVAPAAPVLLLVFVAREGIGEGSQEVALRSELDPVEIIRAEVVPLGERRPGMVRQVGPALADPILPLGVVTGVLGGVLAGQHLGLPKLLHYLMDHTLQQLQLLIKQVTQKQ